MECCRSCEVFNSFFYPQKNPHPKAWRIRFEIIDSEIALSAILL
jgi:hypothetical protein